MASPAEPVPVYRETIAGALIDSARISVMAAREMLPAPEVPLIILPGSAEEMAEDSAMSVHGCLDQAMEWLDAARMHTIEAGAPVTSFHVAGRGPATDSTTSEKAPEGANGVTR
jgi:hypothetical protein